MKVPNLAAPSRARRYFPTILIVALAVFNDGAMIALSKDRVIASPVPNHWNLRNIFISGARAHRTLSFPCQLRFFVLILLVVILPYTLLGLV